MHGVPEGGCSGLQVDYPGICGLSLVPRLRNSNQTGDETIMAGYVGVQLMSAGHAHSTGIAPRR